MMSHAAGKPSFVEVSFSGTVTSFGKEYQSPQVGNPFACLSWIQHNFFFFSRAWARFLTPDTTHGGVFI
jgi:hypothetical protein